MNIAGYLHPMTGIKNGMRYVCEEKDCWHDRLKSCEKFDEKLGSIDDLPIELLHDFNMTGLQELVFISGGMDGWSETFTG